MHKIAGFIVGAFLCLFALIGLHQVIGSPFGNCMDRAMRSGQDWSPGQIAAYCSYEKRYRAKGKTSWE